MRKKNTKNDTNYKIHVTRFDCALVNFEGVSQFEKKKSIEMYKNIGGGGVFRGKKLALHLQFKGVCKNFESMKY